MALYDRDFYAWTQEQAALLRSGQWDRLDIPNLVEEIEALGRQERRELVNRLGILVGHLLKWQFQPQQRSKSWTATIIEQRQEVQELIADNPSLKSYLVEAMNKAYQKSVLLVVKETPLSLDDLPAQCPYTLDQVMDPDFYPEQESPQ
ncbi:DUF29 domain-containing protein [Synechococcus sp. R55.6]|uniref:DUF29 domain-containing protein n=1 Tax=unclassified Synechococcus TaxID=2626047 RepID=UPI0039C03687